MVIEPFANIRPVVTSSNTGNIAFNTQQPATLPLASGYAGDVGDNFATKNSTGLCPELLQAIQAMNYQIPEASKSADGSSSENFYNAYALYRIINKNPQLWELYLKNSEAGTIENANGQAQKSNIQGYDAKKGVLLKNSAEELLKKRGSTVGHCAKSVNDVLGDQISRGDAYLQADKLAKNKDFREVRVDANNLGNLPPGAIVVWGKTSKSPYGHISIATGDGQEISDHKSKQLTNLRGDTECRVFIPV